MADHGSFHGEERPLLWLLLVVVVLLVAITPGLVGLLTQLGG